MAFSVTPAAAQEILAAAVRSDLAGMALRIAARPGNEGVDYGMGFDDQAEGDAVGVFDGLTVLIGPSSQPLLDGLVLDFVEIDPGRRDFVFMPEEEPAASGCASARRSSCGSSGSGSGCSGCGG